MSQPMFQPGQTVIILTAPAAYPYAPGLVGQVNRVGSDPVGGAPIYSVITNRRVGVMPRTRPGGPGGDLYECHGLVGLDLRAFEGDPPWSGVAL